MADAAKAPVLGKTTKARPAQRASSASRSTSRSCTRRRAPSMAARRRGTASTPDPRRGLAAPPPRPGGRRAPAAPAPGALGVPQPLRRRRRLRPRSRGTTRSRSTARRAARRCGRRSRSTPSAARIAVLDAATLRRRRRPSRPREALDKWGAKRPTLIVARRRGDRRRQELPQHRPRHASREVGAIGVADVIGAASLVRLRRRAARARSADGRRSC